MNRIQSAVLQSVLLAAFGAGVAFAFNAVSVNGINPFRDLGDVPVVEGSAAEEIEGIRIIGLDDLRVHLHGD